MDIFKGLWVIPLLLFMGCATVAVTGAGVGVNYTITNVAYKTFTYPLNRVDRATIRALKKMDIKVIDDSKTEKGRRIKAATKELDIIIDLEKITARVTEIRVDARKSAILKDKATAAEIINQVGKNL